MLNNYDKVYSEFIDKVAELHNAHIAFKNKATHETSIRLKKAIASLESHMFVYRGEVKEFRENYKQEQKKLWAEHKNNLKAAAEAKAKRKELREKRKQNEHTTRTTGSI